MFIYLDQNKKIERHDNSHGVTSRYRLHKRKQADSPLQLQSYEFLQWARCTAAV